MAMTEPKDPYDGYFCWDKNGAIGLCSLAAPGIYEFQIANNIFTDIMASSIDRVATLDEVNAAGFEGVGCKNTNDKPRKAKLFKAKPLSYVQELEDDVVSCCDGQDSNRAAPCAARLLANGEIQGPTCGESCSWIMKKSGHGNPPFLHPHRTVDEIKKLLLRSSR